MSSVNFHTLVKCRTTLHNYTRTRHESTWKAPLWGGGEKRWTATSLGLRWRGREHFLVTVSLWSKTVCCWLTGTSRVSLQQTENITVLLRLGWLI